MLSPEEFEELGRLYAHIHFGKTLDLAQKNRTRDILVREHPPAAEMDRVDLKQFAKMVLGAHAMLRKAGLYSPGVAESSA